MSLQPLRRGLRNDPFITVNHRQSVHHYTRSLPGQTTHIKIQSIHPSPFLVPAVVCDPHSQGPYQRLTPHNLAFAINRQA